MPIQPGNKSRSRKPAPKITVTFASEADKTHFIMCHKAAVETEGTMSPLKCGLLSSVLKQASIR